MVLQSDENHAISAGPRIATGCGMDAAAVFDVDTNGLNDLVTFGDLGATIHFADGIGGFVGPTRVVPDMLSVDDPGALTTLDVNHDGLDDILVSQFTGSYTISNQGDGTFGPPVYHTNLGPTEARVADMDHDGFEDIVCISELSLTYGPTIGYGNAAGTLAPFLNHPLGGFIPIRYLDVGDINGDGKLDIACTSFDLDRLIVLLGHGDRTFEPAKTFQTLDGPAHVCIGDVNNDGLDDVVIGEYREGTYAVFLATGDDDVLIRHHDGYVGYGSGVSDTIALTDLDDDGNLDLLTSHWTAGLQVRWGMGTGYFESGPNFDVPSRLTSVRLADINRDGQTDVVCYDYSGKAIYITLNQGGRMIADSTPISVPKTTLGYTIGDFDGVGDLDIAVSDTGGVNIHFANTCDIEPIVRGDTNEDGVLDIDDIPGFVSILVDNSGSLSARKAADMNADGYNDALDIQQFVTCLLTGGC